VPATKILYTTNSGQVVKTPQWYGFVEALRSDQRILQRKINWCWK
jgi:hypothetical protein